MILDFNLKNFLKFNLDRKFCLLFFEHIIFLRFFLRIKKKKAKIWQVYFRIKKKTKKFKKSKKILKLAIFSSKFSENILLEYFKNYEFFFRADSFFYFKENALQKRIWLYLTYIENTFNQKNDLFGNYIKSALFFFKKKIIFWHLLFLKFGPDLLLFHAKKTSFYITKNITFLYLFYRGGKEKNASNFSKKVQIINKYSFFFSGLFSRFEKKTLYTVNECIVLVLNFIHKKKILSFLKNICVTNKTKKRENITIFFQNGEIILDEAHLLLKNHIILIKIHARKNYTKTCLIQKNLLCIGEENYVKKKQDNHNLNYSSGRVNYLRFSFQKIEKKTLFCHFFPIFFPNFFPKIKSSTIHLKKLVKKSINFAFFKKSVGTNPHQNDGYVEKKKEFYQNFHGKGEKCRIEIKKILLWRQIEDVQIPLISPKRIWGKVLLVLVALFPE